MIEVAMKYSNFELKNKVIDRLLNYVTSTIQERFDFLNEHLTEVEKDKVKIKISVYIFLIKY